LRAAAATRQGERSAFWQYYGRNPRRRNQDSSSREQASFQFFCELVLSKGGAMRVLLISADFPPVASGEADHARALASRLAEAGHDVHVLTSALRGVQFERRYTVYPHIKRWNWRAVPGVARLIRRLRPDVMFIVYLSGMYGRHPMATFLPSLARRLSPKTGIVVQIEYTGGIAETLGFGVTLLRRIAVWLVGDAPVSYAYGTLLSASDRIVGLSELHLARLKREHSGVATKASLIPQPPTVVLNSDGPAHARSAGRRALGVGDDEGLIVFFGHVYSGKRFDLLLDAFARLIETRPTLRLAVVGGPLQHPNASGENEQWLNHYLALRERAAATGIEERVAWCGDCPADEPRTSSYLYAADIIVLPFARGVQLNHGSFSAAADHGRPIVTTRAPETEGAFVHGENVFLVEPGDAAALGDGLESLLRDDAMRERLSQGALCMTRDWFDHAAATARTEAILKEAREQAAA